MQRQADSEKLSANGSSLEEDNKALRSEQETNNGLAKGVEGDDLSSEKTGSNVFPEDLIENEEKQLNANKKIHRVQLWTEIRPSLHAIEDMMSIRVEKKGNQPKGQHETKKEHSIEDAKSAKGVSEEDSEDEFYDVERSDPVQDAPSGGSVSASATGATAADVTPLESLFPWKELEVLVRGGVPMALRGEVCIALIFIYFFPFISWYMDFTIDLVLAFPALASICGCENTSSGELLPGSTCFRFYFRKSCRTTV